MAVLMMAPKSLWLKERSGGSVASTPKQSSNEKKTSVVETIDALEDEPFDSLAKSLLAYLARVEVFLGRFSR